MHDANSLKDTNVHYGVFSTGVYFVALDLNQYCFVSELEYFNLQPLHWLLQLTKEMTTIKESLNLKNPRKIVGKSDPREWLKNMIFWDDYWYMIVSIL